MPLLRLNYFLGMEKLLSTIFTFLMEQRQNSIHKAGNKFSTINRNTDIKSKGGDIENSSEFSNLMDRILGNFAKPGDEKEHVSNVSNLSSDQNLDDLIANIWD